MSEIRITADSAGLLYSSNNKAYPARSIKYDRDIKDAGSAEIVIPPDSSALTYGNYDYIKPFRDIVEISRGNDIVFRGRVISKARDFWKNAKLTCEGELAFFKDAVIRAHTYTGSPETLFGSIITEYNSQVDSYKRFSVGVISVTTTERSPELVLEKAVSSADALSLLRTKYGGYFTFRTSDGTRYIDWLSSLSDTTSQPIEFGSNMLDLAITTTNKDYANRIIPYGKQINGEYIALSGGTDYVEDAAGQATYGIVSKTVFFSDVEDAGTLLIRANQMLAESSKMISTITASALDLKELAGVPGIGAAASDGLDVGMTVRVKSVPHEIDMLCLITHRSYDVLNPKNGRITLGGSPVTLTSSLAQNGGA